MNKIIKIFLVILFATIMLTSCGNGSNNSKGVNLNIQVVDTINPLKNKIKQSIEINPFVGRWFDGDNCWISITEDNENIKISYHAGPCQGELKGVFLKDKYNLIHEYSECSYRGFNNDHILGKKIGFTTIINGQLVLDLTIGDDLLQKGGQFFNRVDEE